MTTIFWLGPIVTLYAYVAFPAMVWLLARRRRTTMPAESSMDEAAPCVTVIIPAYNEEKHLEAKITNVLGAQYPSALLDVLVVSDASTDRTDEIARRFAPQGVRLLAQETRRGKTSGLNAAIDKARGDIVVFTDANALYPPDAIRSLAGYFRNPTVGLVSGFTKYTVSAAGEVAEATNAYTSLERVIKSAESRWGCCVGADGAIFAMRRSLYRRLRDDDINDFVLPLTVIEQGFRCLFADEAYCSENPGENLESEFRRQSRITNRSLRAIWRHIHLLNPFRFPSFAFFLFSHKVMRFAVPLFLLTSAASLLILAPRGGIYLLCAVMVALALVLSGAAKLWPNSIAASFQANRLVSLLYVFGTMNLAMLHGWWKFLTGQRDVTWQHDRAVVR